MKTYKFFFLVLVFFNFLNSQFRQTSDLKSLNMVIVISEQQEENDFGAHNIFFHNAIKENVEIVLVSGQCLRASISTFPKLYRPPQRRGGFRVVTEMESIGEIKENKDFNMYNFPWLKDYFNHYNIYKIDQSDLFLFLLKSDFDYGTVFNGNIVRQTDNFTERPEREWKNATEIIKSLFLKKKFDYIWNIVITGHGSDYESQNSRGDISGLSEENFSSLLKFFDKNLKLFSLIYVSCYGGGKHLLSPYTDNYVYNYNIISTTILDEPQYPSYIKFKNLFRRLYNLMIGNTKNFFSKDPWISIFHELTRNVELKPIERMVPVIKFAGKRNFTNLNFDRFFFLTNKNIKNKEVIRIGKKTSSLFIKSNVINPKIEINNKMRVVSISPETTWHYLSEIYSKELAFNDIIDIFKPKHYPMSKEKTPYKLYLIKSIRCVDGNFSSVLIFQKPAKNVMEIENNIYYVENGVPKTNLEYVKQDSKGMFHWLAWSKKENGYIQDNRFKAVPIEYLIFYDIFDWIDSFKIDQGKYPFLEKETKSNFFDYISIIFGSSVEDQFFYKFFFILNKIIKLSGISKEDITYDILKRSLFVVNENLPDDLLYINLTGANLQNIDIANKLVSQLIELDKLSAIYALNLSRSNLSEIPSNIDMLHNLIYLDLSENYYLNTTIPKSIKNLQNLKKIFLPHNRRFSLPEEIQNSQVEIDGTYTFRRGHRPRLNTNNLW